MIWPENLKASKSNFGLKIQKVDEVRLKVGVFAKLRIQLEVYYSLNEIESVVQGL